MEPIMNVKWDELNLKPSLLRGIYSYGFEVPSNIQKLAIPDIIAGIASFCILLGTSNP